MTAPIPMAQAVYSFGVGGSERLAWQIARALNGGSRYRCLMYAVAESGPMARLLESEGIDTRAFSRRRRIDLPLILRLATRFRRDGVRLVHTHHVGQLLNAGLAARLAGAKVVHTEHECFSLRRERTRRLLRSLSVLADVVTAVAAPVTEFLLDTVRIPARRIRTIENGVDLPAFERAVPARRRDLGLPEGAVVIGCVARLEAAKAHPVLLQAFGTLHRRRPNARLVIVGDGGERHRLAGMAEGLGLNGSVKFLGLRNDIPSVLAACDLVTLPSLEEGLPLVLLESMAAGKPVVSTAVGSIPVLIRHGDNGLLVPPGDAPALADALETLVLHGDARERMGTRALKTVREKHSFERTLNEYQAVYEQALAGAS